MLLHSFSPSHQLMLLFTYLHSVLFIFLCFLVISHCPTLISLRSQAHYFPKLSLNKTLYLYLYGQVVLLHLSHAILLTFAWIYLNGRRKSHPFVHKAFTNNYLHDSPWCCFSCLFTAIGRR